MEDIKDKNQVVIQEMGVDTSKVFSGEYKFESEKKLYSESAQMFADLINKYLSEEGEYTIADLGSYKGELMKEILKKLNPESDYRVIGIDINHDALERNNTSSEKAVANLDNLPLRDNSVDVAISRYTLVWNSVERQKEILKEFSRVVKVAAFIQHAGADSDKEDEWREKMDDLLDGEEVLKLKRDEHYFSSREEIERWMNEMGIKFIRNDEVSVPEVSDVLIDRYSLDKDEAEEAKKILGKFDYIIRSTWIILPKE